MTATVVVINRQSVVAVENVGNGSTAVVTATAGASVCVSGVGARGLPGPAGPAGGATRVGLAGAAVSGHRVVIEDESGTVIHADALSVAHAERVVGVSSNAAAEGDPVTIIERGRMADASFAFTPGLPVFLGLDGALTQTPPAAPGFILQIGAATAPDVLQVRLAPPIYRS